MDKDYLETLLATITNQVETKRTKIYDIIDDVRTQIRDVDDIYRLVPIVKDLLDVSVKNEDQLTKAATIIQRVLSSEKASGGGMDDLLSDADKDMLIKAAQESQQEENQIKTAETILKGS